MKKNKMKEKWYAEKLENRVYQTMLTSASWQFLNALVESAFTMLPGKLFHALNT